MFRHILVPLDGSRLAESALAPAARLARRMDAAVTIVHVIEKNAPSEVHSERHLVTPEEASAYLKEVSRLSVLSGLRIVTHVHTAEVSDVPRSITEHSAELAPDLIVMSTHGRGSARRLIFGDIAQQVIARGVTPVLMVRPTEHGGKSMGAEEWRTILAPIDGDPSHERGLPVGADLALAFACRLVLLMVVPTIGELTGSQAAASILLPGATREKLEMDRAGAQEYLEERAALLKERGVIAGCEASRGDPARAIVAARRLTADLIVMGTHGRAGTDAFWAGSVAARVVARAQAPLLLVPLKEQASTK